MDIKNIRKRDKAALVAELERAGAKFKGKSCTCPFHDDKHPSAGIYQTADGYWFFKCQTCGVGGDVWDVQAKSEGKAPSDVLRAAVGRAGRTERAFKGEFKSKTYPTVEDLKKACPGEVEDVYRYTNPATMKVDLIIIRSMTEDGKTFRQCRPCPGGYEMSAPPKPWPLYNRKRAGEADTAIVVEGEKCVHVLHEYGIPATTNPGGAGKAEHTDWSLLADKNVILWPDNDQPGYKHMRQVEACLSRLEPPPRVSLLDPVKLELAEKEDVADYVEKLKSAGVDVATGLRDIFQQSRPKGVSDGVLQKIEAAISGKITTIPWPQTDMAEQANALMPGTVTLICGSPGASKSFWLLQCLAYWIKQDVKSCIYQLEEDTDYHLGRVLAQESGNSMLTNLKWISEAGAEAISDYAKHREFLDIVGKAMWASPDEQVTLEQLAVWTEKRAKAGYRIIAVDPVTATAQTGRPWEKDNAFMQKIKKTATEYECSIVLVTHPSKTFCGPDLNQLAGGAAYSRFSQCILWLESHKEKTNEIRKDGITLPDTHNRTIHILKARNGTGTGHRVAAVFDTSNLTIRELGLIE